MPARGKGIAWLPIAVGVIFLVQVLVFSLVFTQFTILNREVIDSNIVFEGSEMETYARSIEASAQMALASGIFEFTDKHRLALWYNYGHKDLMPSEDSVESQLSQFSTPVFGGFIEAHMSFIPDPSDYGRAPVEVSWEGGLGEVSTSDYAMSIGLGKVELKKTAPGIANFRREFLPEADLVTAFGKMTRFIRDELIGKDVVGSYVREAIGRPYGPGAGEAKAVCLSPDRESESPRQLHSYIDEHVGLPEKFAEIATYGRKSQTQTAGSVKFCDMDDWERTDVCACDDPCRPTDEAKLIVSLDGRLYASQPSPDVVYEDTHGQTFGSGQELIVNYGRERLTCLEGELDDQSEDYTVAFDGDKTEPGLGPMKMEVRSQIAGSCSSSDVGGECRGYAKGSCGSCPLPGGGETTKYLWTCPKVRLETCDPFDHYAEGSAEVRFQEDGFVYPMEEPDSVRLVFKAVSGNMEGIGPT